jgi:hypothetical protein
MIPRESALEADFPGLWYTLLFRTADSTDFTDFEEVIEDDHTNLFVAKLQGAANRNLLFVRSPPVAARLGCGLPGRKLTRLTADPAAAGSASCAHFSREREKCGLELFWT